MTEQAFSAELAVLERNGDLAAVDELIEAVPAGGRLVAIEGGALGGPLVTSSLTPSTSWRAMTR